VVVVVDIVVLRAVDTSTRVLTRQCGATVVMVVEG
jgi:hypothetical protein